ncbi:MAG TPA: hypothetical protein VMG81_03975 [Thermoplasmata archaeon]|nr:hypothetical protein [Thermoplasmata archaeon]
MTSAADLAILAGFATGMAATSAIAVKWAAFARGPLRASVVLFVLAMMAAMFAGVLVYFALGGAAGLIAGLWAAAALMSASAFIVFVGFAREVRLRQGPRDARPSPGSRLGFVAAVIGLVIANEFLMGWSFSLLAGTLPVGFGPGGRELLGVLAGAVTSPWFVFPMALEMVLTLRFLGVGFPRSMRPFLLVQPAIMICSPPTIAGFPWLVSTTVGASALMGLAIAWLLIGLFRGEPLAPNVARYLLAFFGSLGLMAAGLVAWVAYAVPELFALSLVVQMTVFLWAVTDPTHFAAPELQDRDRPAPRPVGAGVDGS